jgi:hypothetical protein
MHAEDDQPDHAGDIGVADLVQHRARAVARLNRRRVVQPFISDAQPQVPAAAGQVQRHLRPVAGVGAERGVRPVQGAVEELAAVLDDEVVTVRAVAQRAVDVLPQQRRRGRRGDRLAGDGDDQHDGDDDGGRKPLH